MDFTDIDKVYAKNDAIRADLKETLTGLSDEQLDARAEGEGWSIREIVEHLAMVNNGAVRICSRLLGKAEEAGLPFKGFIVSNDFIQKGKGAVGVKLQAPEIVQPVSGASLADSLAALEASREAMISLREKFQRFDGIDPKFPHPYFGDLSAQEWFVLSGAHEERHLRQIHRLLEKLD